MRKIAGVAIITSVAVPKNAFSFKACTRVHLANSRGFPSSCQLYRLADQGANTLGRGQWNVKPSQWVPHLLAMGVASIHF